ncbi:beta-galactosidase 3-like [Papaver somniferum]|uniref:beta-galactosidase 3-like n=1 Tax=Papaver somniferum TaxID=3469 RepID=UPI000E6F4F14|nr:beta-galactosidase 3-like [Papaver somniferum]
MSWALDRSIRQKLEKKTDIISSQTGDLTNVIPEVKLLVFIWVDLYHVPRSWFKPSGNILVIFEEKGGDPSKIKFSRRKVTSVCALISEDYPSFEYESWKEDMTVKNESNPTLHLSCPKGTIISAIKFASFGTPTGECGSYSVGDCHDSTSLLKVEKVCLNKLECSIALSNRNFNMTLCRSSTKKLTVEAECSGSS